VSVKYDVAVELLNDKGVVIGKQNVTLSAGYSAGFSNGTMDTPPTVGKTTVTFPAVDANKITDNLTIRVASLDGTAAQTAAKAKSVSITTAAESEYVKETLASIASNMVQVKGGTFTMGNPSWNRGSNETPHQVTVSAFSMGKYEVTQDEY